MLHLGTTFLNRPIMSLRTSSAVAVALRPIINPNNLKIEGFHCQDTLQKRQSILLTQDIRDIIKEGFVIDDHEVLANSEDLVRLKEVLNIDFDLLGKSIVTTRKYKLGKVTDYSADSTTFYIQKLYASQPLYKSFNGGQLAIDRTQIIEITNKYIIVKDPLQATKVPVIANASAA